MGLASRTSRAVLEGVVMAAGCATGGCRYPGCSDASPIFGGGPSEQPQGIEPPFPGRFRLASGCAALEHLHAFAHQPGGAGAPLQAETPGGLARGGAQLERVAIGRERDHRATLQGGHGLALMEQAVRSGGSNTFRWIRRAASAACRSFGTELSLRGASLEVQITMSPSCWPGPAAEAW